MKHAPLNDPELLKYGFDTAYLSKKWLHIFKNDVDQFEIQLLQGDASTRQYFRLTPSSEQISTEPTSLVLMQLEKPEPDKNEIDFTLLLKFLKNNHILVPKLFHYDVKNGLLFLEDCGNSTFEDFVKPLNSNEKLVWYEKAIDLLSNLQFYSTKKIDSHCPAYHRRFDTEKLTWELNFMLEHFVKGLLQAKLSDTRINEIQSHFLELCRELESQPLWFTHRDFHSRNLMVQNNQLVVIDFQDARMGPCQYDLVSLLRDSYVQLPEPWVDNLIDRFIHNKEKLEKNNIDKKEFIKIFDYMAIQRNLKAIGTFAYQSVCKQNNRYIQYIQPTLGYVKRTLNRQPELSSLKKALENIIPDLTASNKTI